MAETQLRFVMHLRGLPWSCTEEQVVSFLELSPENLIEVNLQQNDRGQPNGEAYVVCNDQASAEHALSKHRETMPDTNRYVEIFKSSDSAMQAGTGSGGKGQWDGVIKCKGIPFQCTEEDIANFFSGLKWLENGITLPQDGSGQCIGEAYVQFEDYNNANMALERNKQEINGRWVDVSKSNNNDLRKAIILGMKKACGMNTQVQPQMQQQNGNGNTWGGLNLGAGGRGRPY